jgi:isoleucyl-tRNA synthetase
MKREEEVIDCWYDSGSAFFAQWHYPFENKDEFKENFPVDFISEALDQTRGWFYSLLAISTFLFNKPSYKNVLTLGLVLDKENQKMSKSKKNYVDPNIILDHEGADALRWYLISSNAPWMSTRFYEDAVKDSLGKFILTYWNSYNFFATYASLDAFDPRQNMPSNSERSLLDQWILSKFNSLVEDIHKAVKTFDIHKAARSIENFIIDDFSNWYLRRSRKRFWEEEHTDDKKAGYATMYDIFLNLTKILSPFIPFITEEIYQNIRTDDMPESIHLNDYPTHDLSLQNQQLEQGMEHIRTLVEIGRALRSKIGIKVRYPLLKATIVCNKTIESQIKNLLPLLQEELNVKTLSFSRDTSEFMTKMVKPNYSNLGPRLKEKAKQVLKTIEEIDKVELYQILKEKKQYIVKLEDEDIVLSMNDFEIVEQVKSHIAQTQTEDVTLFLDTILTPELEAEGLARELVRRIQSMRKELNLAVEDRITTEIYIDQEKQKLIQQWNEYIKNETRTEKLHFSDKPSGKLVKTWTIDDLTATIGIT